MISVTDCAGYFRVQSPMSVAFHFNSDHKEVGLDYESGVRESIQALVPPETWKKLSANLKARDLQFHRQKSTILSPELTNYKFDPEQTAKILEDWLAQLDRLYSQFSSTDPAFLLSVNFFVYVLKDTPFLVVQDLHNRLAQLPWYIGVVEIDYTCEIHRELYTTDKMSEE